MSDAEFQAKHEPKHTGTDVLKFVLLMHVEVHPIRSMVNLSYRGGKLKRKARMRELLIAEAQVYELLCDMHRNYFTVPSPPIFHVTRLVANLRYVIGGYRKKYAGMGYVIYNPKGLLAAIEMEYRLFRGLLQIREASLWS